MKVHSISTDNACIKSKISLRENAVSKLEKVNVLDLFAGNNEIWGKIGSDYYYGIEIEKGKGKNLNADNKKVIPSLDLTKFNVIDCDSYGVPFDQIDLLFKNNTLQKGTIIFYTCISNAMSSINKNIAKYFNLTEINKKCKTLVSSKNCELFFAYLQKRGIKTVTEFSIHSNFEKHYGYFVV